jgi:hypothetical protein
MRSGPGQLVLVGLSAAALLLAAGPAGAARAPAGSAGSGTSVPASAGQAAADDPTAALKAIPGMKVVSRKDLGKGQSFFVLTYRQPADHDRPGGATFEQRLSLLHIGSARPMVLHTSGYNLTSTEAFAAEPTRILDANQIDVEQRFFSPSRPSPASWKDLSIKQAATDHHRIVQALTALYPKKWISTGASKGGMTSVYHRRFFPGDVDGTVAYVAPNDVDNTADSYVRFIQGVGTDRACNAALQTMQRTALQRRGPMTKLLAGLAKQQHLTYAKSYGTVDRAFEAAVLDTPFAFWQYGSAAGCPTVPAAKATDQQVFDFIGGVAGWDFYSDQGVGPFVPYFYQAARQLGWPNTSDASFLKGLLRYREAGSAPTAVPRVIRPTFEPNAMRDVDTWVRTSSSQMLFIYGENDPWSAEQFAVGNGAKDGAVFIQKSGNHGSSITGLSATDEATATALVKRWAGTAAAAAPSKVAASPPLPTEESLRRTSALHP